MKISSIEELIFTPWNYIPDWGGFPGPAPTRTDFLGCGDGVVGKDQTLRMQTTQGASPLLAMLLSTIFWSVDTLLLLLLLLLMHGITTHSPDSAPVVEYGIKSVSIRSNSDIF